MSHFAQRQKITTASYTSFQFQDPIIIYEIRSTANEAVFSHGIPTVFSLPPKILNMFYKNGNYDSFKKMVLHFHVKFGESPSTNKIRKIIYATLKLTCKSMELRYLYVNIWPLRNISGLSVRSKIRREY